MKDRLIQTVAILAIFLAIAGAVVLSLRQAPEPEMTVEEALELGGGKFSQDFLISVALGDIPGWSTCIMSGHNPSQTSASGFIDLCESGVDIAYLTTAEQLTVGSTDDDDKTADTGAITLLLTG